MRIIFMGTPHFAVPALRKLAQVHEVCAVVTRPDAVSGRGKKVLPSPVKQCALVLNIPELIETKSLRSPELQKRLSDLSPDVIVVAAFGCILPREVLELPRFGCINIHASLLPRWRGAAPIQRAVLEGDTQAGVSIMRMEEGLDTGDWCAQAGMPVENLSSPELMDALAHMGADLLIEALSDIEQETAVWHVQDEQFVTYADKISKEEVLLSPQLSREGCLRRVRASSDSAPARCVVCDKPLRVMKAQVPAGDTTHDVKPGDVHVQKGLVVIGCRDGSLELVEIKPDGKGAMAASAWVSGLRDAPQVWHAL